VAVGLKVIILHYFGYSLNNSLYCTCPVAVICVAVNDLTMTRIDIVRKLKFWSRHLTSYSSRSVLESV